MILNKYVAGLGIALLSMITLAYADVPVINGYTGDQENLSAGPAGGINDVMPGEVSDSDGSTQTQQDAANAADTADTSNLSLPQRVARLETQMNAQNQVDLLNRVNQMQQEVQQLRGQLDTANHQLQQLQKQSQTRYQDLDQRLMALQGGGESSHISVSKAKDPSTASLAKVIVHPSASTEAQGATAAKPTTATPKAQSKNPVLLATNDIADAGGVGDYQAYEQAYAYIQQQQYPEATTALEAYIKKYPKGMYQANAHYWLGELYLKSGNLALAKNAFNDVISNFPKSNKAPDSQLKLGFVYYDMGQMQQAANEFELVKQRFPNTSAARIAQERLAAMPKG